MVGLDDLPQREMAGPAPGQALSKGTVTRPDQTVPFLSIWTWPRNYYASTLGHEESSEGRQSRAGENPVKAAVGMDGKWLPRRVLSMGGFFVATKFRFAFPPVIAASLILALLLPARSPAQEQGQ